MSDPNVFVKDQLKVLEEMTGKLRGMSASQLSALRDARNVLVHAARADEEAGRAIAEASRLLAGVAMPRSSAGAATDLQLSGVTTYVAEVTAIADRTRRHFHESLAAFEQLSPTAPVDCGIAANVSMDTIVCSSPAYRVVDALLLPAQADEGVVFHAPAGNVDNIFITYRPDADHSKYFVTEVLRDSVAASLDPKKVLRRQFLKLVRIINRLIAQIIRRLDGLTSSSEFVEKFRPFQMTHGNHPPDASASPVFPLTA